MIRIKFVVDETEHFLDGLVQELDMGTTKRPLNALKRSHIDTIQDCMEMLEHYDEMVDSGRVKGVGKATLEQIILGLVKRHMEGMTEIERALYYLKIAELNGHDPEKFLEEMGA